MISNGLLFTLDFVAMGVTKGWTEVEKRKVQCIIVPGETKIVGVWVVEEATWESGQSQKTGCFLWCFIRSIYGFLNT